MDWTSRFFWSMVLISFGFTGAIVFVANVSLVHRCETEETETVALPDGVEIFTMGDGTRCVLFDHGYRGGIDCDWKRGE